MQITGENFIGYTRSSQGGHCFHAYSPAINTYLPEKFCYATHEEFEAALLMAETAYPVFKDLSATRRAEFLDAIAAEIEALGDILVDRAMTESGLPDGRIRNERARTCGQLRMFAQLLRDGWWVDARIDLADPDRSTPKPDIRRMLMPLGPVAVYGASNFPLAFSTAGGDTASALAAGCPVIVKAHSSHPGTNELVASAIIKAARSTSMPEGVFSSLNLTHEKSIELTKHDAIKAVGFTGSRKVGMMLFNAAVSRDEPIPVYAEMSAVNPVILMEQALKTRSAEIARGLAASVLLGVGQFCTNPGLVLVNASEASSAFINDFVQHLKAALPGTMLNKAIPQAYWKHIAELEQIEKVTTLIPGKSEDELGHNEVTPAVFIVKDEEFLSNKKLAEEIFGPATLIVVCRENQYLKRVLKGMEGQLTATIHAEAADEENVKPLVDIATEKAGRIIFNGFPTGVEVCHAMHHGGPFPSTTDARSTSVGTAAIYRFLRPVAYQDFPNTLLPEALKNGNPLNIMRLVNGSWTTDHIRRQHVYEAG